jgi:hypothetical protein
MGADCKSAGYAYASSNLARPIHTSLCSSVVEHTLGKGEVMSSILIIGFLRPKAFSPRSLVITTASGIYSIWVQVVLGCDRCHWVIDLAQIWLSALEREFRDFGANQGD